MAHIEFNGIKYYLTGRYYRQSGHHPGASHLHRAVWEHHNGPIPAGRHVHHKDGNPANNHIANLELLSHSEHNRIHAIEQHEAGNLGNTPEGREKAKRWHASEEGKAFHREHGAKTLGRKAWETRVWHAKTCETCGGAYETPYPNKSKFCCVPCKSAAQSKRRRA